MLPSSGAWTAFPRSTPAWTSRLQRDAQRMGAVRSRLGAGLGHLADDVENRLHFSLETAFRGLPERDSFGIAKGGGELSDYRPHIARALAQVATTDAGRG